MDVPVALPVCLGDTRRVLREVLPREVTRVVQGDTRVADLQAADQEGSPAAARAEEAAEGERRIPKTRFALNRGLEFATCIRKVAARR